MFPLLAPYLEKIWGPFRLFQSHMMLIGMGTVFAALLVFFLIPVMRKHLPLDRGRPFTTTFTEAQGKPTGAGLLLTPAFLLSLFLFQPLGIRVWQIAACLVLAMFCGYLDDRSQDSWHENRKLLLDLLVAGATALAFCQGQTVAIWVPLFSDPVSLPAWLYLIIAGMVLMIAINTTNCSDGVDGLAGTLTLMSLFYMGGFLYVVVGHAGVADYLLVPHNEQGAEWAILIFTGAGVLAGYLWYNAEPSSVLMGDAGSRFFGLLVGVAVLASGNPFLIVSIAPIVLLNGGTGLVKLLILRGLRKLGFDVRSPEIVAESKRNGDFGDNGRHSRLAVYLHSIRFPLHDHCLKNLGWSKTQVLVRFFLLQTFLIPILLGLLVKLR